MKNGTASISRLSVATVVMVFGLTWIHHAFATDVTCDYFGFPFVSGDSARITFFDCETGQLRVYDANGTSVVPLESEKNLGGFVQKLNWSPDGNRALILAENVSAAKQELMFRTSDRELNSLNWWLYDVRTDRAELLDGHVIDAGWVSADRIIYDWDNSKLSVSDIADLGKFEKIADIPDSYIRTPDDGLSPVSSGSTVVFPMKKGLFSVSDGGHRATFIPVDGSIMRIVANPFTPDDYAVWTDSGMFRLNSASGSFRRIDSGLTVRDIVYYAPDTLALLVGNGTVYVHDMTSGKEDVLMNVTGSVGKIFSIAREREILFTSGSEVFKKVGTESAVSLRGIGPETDTPDGTVSELSGVAVDPYASIGGVSGLVGIVILAIIMIGVLVVVMIRRRRQA